MSCVSPASDCLMFQMRCLLNIWGVMLFLRLTWVIGQCGICKLYRQIHIMSWSELFLDAVPSQAFVMSDNLKLAGLALPYFSLMITNCDLCRARPAVHDSVQCCHSRHLHLHVGGGHQWTDRRRRSLLHDLPLPRTGVWRSHRSDVHPGKLHCRGHVHDRFL